MSGASEKRGSIALPAMLAIAAVTTVVVLGLDARTNDLTFQQRTLCRAAAHSAAESGVARAMALLDRRGASRTALRGVLEGGMDRSEVRYEVVVEPKGNGVSIVAGGSCRLRGIERPMKAQIVTEVARSPSGWSFVGWEEGPPNDI